MRSCDGTNKSNGYNCSCGRVHHECFGCGVRLTDDNHAHGGRCKSCYSDEQARDYSARLEANDPYRGFPFPG